MNMGTYSKLIGSFVGSIVAAAMAYLATRGLGTCVTGPDAVQACSIFGFSDIFITSTVMTIVSGLSVYAFPKNKPPS